MKATDVTKLRAEIIARSGIPADKITVIAVRQEPPDLTKLTISQLAVLIKSDWKPVWFGAVPYLDAMVSLRDVSDSVGADSARSIIGYFLCNAKHWRGETAKAVKAELKRRVKL
jgi:hypothetical protein